MIKFQARGYQIWPQRKNNVWLGRQDIDIPEWARPGSNLNAHWQMNGKDVMCVCVCVCVCISSVQFSRSVVSDCLRPHELQHARPPCPSPAPRVHPNPCPLSWWCHPTISSSVIPFSSRLQFFPASGSFQMNQLFAWGGQNIGVSASTSVLPMNTQDWSPLG